MNRFFATIPLALLALTGVATAEKVWVVDQNQGAGSDFAGIQQAVLAASDGDLILVRPGFYTGVVIDGLRVTLQADVGGLVRVNWIRVRNLAAGQPVSVRGFDMELGNTIEITDCSGAVLLEDLTCVSYDPNFVGGAWAVIENSDRVTARNCAFQGQQGDPKPGVIARDARIALYECILEGGDGVPLPGFPGPASPGLLLNGSEAVVMLCQIQGGMGAPDEPFLGGGPGPGAPAAALFAGSSVQTFSSTLQGGLHGQGFPLAPPYSLASGSLLHARPQLGRSMSIASPLREGQTTTMRFTGFPGDVVSVYVSRNPGDWRIRNRRVGPRVLDQILNVIPVGVIGPSGHLELPFTAPQVPGDFHSLVFQPAFLTGRADLHSGTVIGSPTQMHILDAGF